MESADANVIVMQGKKIGEKKRRYQDTLSLHVKQILNDRYSSTMVIVLLQIWGIVKHKRTYNLSCYLLDSWYTLSIFSESDFEARLLSDQKDSHLNSVTIVPVLKHIYEDKHICRYIYYM